MFKKNLMIKIKNNDIIEDEMVAYYEKIRFIIESFNGAFLLVYFTLGNMENF